MGIDNHTTQPLKIKHIVNTETKVGKLETKVGKLETKVGKLKNSLKLA